MVTIPFAAFEPDKNRYNNAAMPEMMNVRPVSDGWAPLPSFVMMQPAFNYLLDENGDYLLDENGDYLIEGPDGEALAGPIQLPGSCIGSIYCRTASGITRAFFGTADTLYEYNFSTRVFVEVGTGYAVPTGGRWSFAVFGTTLYAQNGQDAEQFIDLTAGTAFADNATAPICSYIATIGDFIVRTRDASNPIKMQWSALNDPTSNDPGLGGSDVNYLPDGNGIAGIVPMSYGAMVLCRDSIHQMNFSLASDWIFSFSPVTKYRGAIAPYSICQIGQDDFVFYSADGFFRGPSMQPIGAERVDRWFLTQTEEGSRVAMTAAPDYRRKIVWFRYLGVDGTYKIIGYNWQLDRWCQCNADMIDLMRAESPDVTIEGLDYLYETIDDIDVSIDSSSFDGGSVELAGITPDGFFAYMNGTNMEATFSTNEVSFNGTSRAIVNGGRLNSDAANFEVVVSTTDYKGSNSVDRDPVTPSSRTRSLALRADGRTHMFRITIPAGEPWTNATALDVGVVATGRS